MKTLVVEDSRLAREGLIKMLAQFTQLEIVGAAEHAEQARVLIAQHRPELLFLDIHLPGETGFDLLESLDYTPRVIFTTAYSDYAIRSFDYQTVDYLLKPVSQERLSLAVDKLTATPGKAPPTEPPLAMDSRIFIKDGDQCHLIQVAVIEYMESCKNYTQLFFDNKKAFVKKSLNQLEQRLPACNFFRANRQHIINLGAIAAIDESINDGYQVTMTDGCTIEISRRNALRLKELLSL